MDTNVVRSVILVGTVAVCGAGYAQTTPESDAKMPAAEAKQGLLESEFTVSSTGTIWLEPSKHSPIYADFDGSPALTERLRTALKELGLETAAEKRDARASITFKGDLVLLGGPKFSKGKKVSVGNATEKALKNENGEVTRADVVGTAAGMALNGAAFTGAMGNFTRGLAIGGMVNALGDAGGMRGWFNTAVAGDPRGVCLSKCEDWKKVNQTVHLWVTMETEAKRDEVRVLIKAFSETVAPDQVVAIAVGKAVEQIQIARSAQPAEKIGLAQEVK